MTEPKFMCRCDTCGGQFQFGPHIYDGKHIDAYGITVCMGCYRGNWDGWAPHYEPVITRNLKEHGLPLPKRNEKGWLPRDG